MCFAIPSDAAMPIINAMIKGESYEALLGKISTKPAVLGISGDNVKITSGGVYGVKITAFTSTDYDICTKLQVGDVITKIDGAAVTSITEIRLILDKKLPGESIVITFYRDGQYQNATVVLGS
jgi:serine protease Do